MKNIHVLPTSQPSRLFTWGNKLRLGDLVGCPDYFGKLNKNIYITDDSLIKDDEWHLHYYEGKPVISKSHNGASEYINLKAKEFGYKKIIMTTDPNLIKDGVQEIPDEFLQWFVENPSCEFVEVESKIRWKTRTYDQPDVENGFDYKIIIPQEEPKAIDFELVSVGEETVKLYIQEPKEETLEEAAENNSVDEDSSTYSDKINKEMYLISISSFKSGAKWQAKRMYSAEEIKEIMFEWFNYQIDEDVEIKLSFSKWFDEFKKK
jgi:hypothetical protein